MRNILCKNYRDTIRPQIISLFLSAFHTLADNTDKIEEQLECGLKPLLHSASTK